MPPFSSALLPLSLKEIGGLGPTEGDCVPRLPTIMTLRTTARRLRDTPDGVCSNLFARLTSFPFFSPSLSILRSLTVARCCSDRLEKQLSKQGSGKIELFFSCVRGGRCRGWGTERKKDRESQGQETRECSCTSCLSRPCLRQKEGTGAAFISSSIPPLTPFLPPPSVLYPPSIPHFLPPVFFFFFW